MSSYIHVQCVEERKRGERETERERQREKEREMASIYPRMAPTEQSESGAGERGQYRANCTADEGVGITDGTDDALLDIGACAEVHFAPQVSDQVLEVETHALSQLVFLLSHVGQNEGEVVGEVGVLFQLLQSLPPRANTPEDKASQKREGKYRNCQKINIRQ